MRILGEGLWQQRVFGREMKICLYFSLFLFDGISFGFSFFLSYSRLFSVFFCKMCSQIRTVLYNCIYFIFSPFSFFSLPFNSSISQSPSPRIKKTNKISPLLSSPPFFTRSRNHNLPQVGPKTRAQKYPPSAIIESGAAAKKGSGAVIMIHGGSGATWLGGNEDARGAREL